MPTRLDHAAHLWSSVQPLKREVNVGYSAVGNHDRLRWPRYSRPLLALYINNNNIKFIGSRKQIFYKKLPASVCYDGRNRRGTIVGLPNVNQKPGLCRQFQ